MKVLVGYGSNHLSVGWGMSSSSISIETVNRERWAVAEMPCMYAMIRISSILMEPDCV